MSFGIGIGDILAVTRLGVGIWSTCREYSTERAAIAVQLRLFRTRLSMFEGIITTGKLPPDAVSTAQEILSECFKQLQQIEETNEQGVKKDSVWRKTKWAVSERDNFVGYLQLLGALTDGLESLTKLWVV